MTDDFEQATLSRNFISLVRGLQVGITPKINRLLAGWTPEEDRRPLGCGGTNLNTPHVPHRDKVARSRYSMDS